jgi:hypothetical protein
VTERCSDHPSIPIARPSTGRRLCESRPDETDPGRILRLAADGATHAFGKGGHVNDISERPQQPMRDFVRPHCGLYRVTGCRCCEGRRSQQESGLSAFRTRGELGPHELHVNSSIRALANQRPRDGWHHFVWLWPGRIRQGPRHSKLPNRQRVSRATMVLANAELPSTARAVGAVQPVRRIRARASKAKTRWLSHK